MKKYLLLLLVLPLHLWARCPSLQARTNDLIPISQLSPTQMSYGSLSIPSKINKIINAYKQKNITKYLKSKIAPVVIGPHCKIWITDRHHTSIAILKSTIPQKYKGLYIKVLKDWSNKTQKEFINLMKESNYVWLKNNNGIEKKFSELPKSVADLNEDPYRSLAWLVAKKNGFKKIEKPFLEFYWAEFFKSSNLKLSSSNKNEINEIIDQALKLAKSKKASHMPGFIQN